MKRIVIKFHALKRLSERCDLFGLVYDDARRRTEEVVFLRCQSLTKKSKSGVVYYKYFQDGLSFFVVCKENRFAISVLTIIIKEGRE